MQTVKDLLVYRGNARVYRVAPFDTVAAALETMCERDLSAILVMDGEEVVGLFSERDYARKLLLQGKSSLVTPVRDVMNRDVLYVTPDDALEECLALMTNKHIRHLPVLDGGRVLALISIDDVVEATLDGKEFLIAELTRYVTGGAEPVAPERRRRRWRELIWRPRERTESQNL